MKPTDAPKYPPASNTADDIYGVCMNLFDRAHLSDEDAQGYVLSVARELVSMVLARVEEGPGREKLLRTFCDMAYQLAEERGKMVQQVAKIVEAYKAPEEE